MQPQDQENVHQTTNDCEKEWPRNKETYFKECRNVKDWFITAVFCTHRMRSPVEWSLNICSQYRYHALALQLVWNKANLSGSASVESTDNFLSHNTLKINHTIKLLALHWIKLVAYNLKHEIYYLGIHWKTWIMSESLICQLIFHIMTIHSDVSSLIANKTYAANKFVLFGSNLV